MKKESKKKLLVYRWGSLSEPLLCNALQDLEINYIEFARELKNYHADAEFAGELIGAIHAYGVEGVISYDYFPMISMICEINHIPYFAWIYDCPQYTLLSKTLSNSYNYIFCFDKIYCERLQEMGAVNCIHYPLAGSKDMAEAAAREAKKLPVSTADREPQAELWKQKEHFVCDISFVGNLYNDKKNRLRQAELSEYAAGYIEGLIRAQTLVYGYNFIKDTLPENIAEEVIQKCDLTLGEEYQWDGLQMAADAVGMEVSARERELVLKTIGEHYPVNLYTTSELPNTLSNAKIQKMGYADYQKEVPLIFHNSRINLNVTSKTIESGIPQRIFDVLSCGGFCLTNYQPEIAEYFEDGVDLVMYYSMEDLLEKVSYYLEHEEERAQIAENGHRKVMENFEIRDRLKEMLERGFV